MRKLNSLIDLVHDAVDKGATSVEEIQKIILNQPLDVLESIEPLKESSKKVRNLQNATIGSVYDAIRGVNDEVSKVAKQVLGEREAGAGTGGGSAVLRDG